jgi:putative cardiolipin synthase
MEDGAVVLQKLARQGVRVRVLTNSLSANDVAAVHAGYAKRREPLLEAGVTRLNTEMVLVIEDPELAGRLHGWFDARVPMLASEVKLAGDGSLTWINRTESGETRYDIEPGAGFFLRAWVGFPSLLPIEREL